MNGASFHQLHPLIETHPALLEGICERVAQAAQEDPEGRGWVAMEALRSGRFIDPQVRAGLDTGRALLVSLSAAIGLVRGGRALYLDTGGPERLLVPQSVLKARPTLPEAAGASRITFKGPVERVLAGLVCRLSLSGIFSLWGIWHQGACWSSNLGGLCWLSLGGPGGDLTLCFDRAVGRQTRRYFEEFIMEHLGQLASVSRLARTCAFICPACTTPVTALQVARRQERGHEEMSCCVCGESLSLLDPMAPQKGDARSIVGEMARAASSRRDRQVAALNLMGKRSVRDYDVWLIHREVDRAAVLKIGDWLEERGLLPWIAAWEKRDSPPEGSVKAIAVVVGKESVGPWYDLEVDAVMRVFDQKHKKVVPVILPTCEEPPFFPEYVDESLIADFRHQRPDPMVSLVEGITARR